MSFIAKIFLEENYGVNDYGILAVVRSALSVILPKQNGKPFGQEEIVNQTIRGIIKLRPSFPTYTVTYNPDVILKYMNRLPENEQLNLEMLTKKLPTLLCLLSRKRSQSIQKVRLDYASFQKDKCNFYIPTVLKKIKNRKTSGPTYIYKISRKHKNLYHSLH